VVKRPLPDGPYEASHRGANQYHANENQQDQDLHGSPFFDKAITVYASVISELSGISTAATQGFINPAIASETAAKL
jgi:hypothetical protein